MKIWKVTIKEKLMDRPITTTYTGDVDYEFVKKFFGRSLMLMVLLEKEKSYEYN